MKHLWRNIVLGTLGVGLVVIVVLLVAPKSPIPPTVTKQLTSTLLVPKGGGAVIDRESANYSKSEKLLIYTVAYAGTSIIVSEQPTPDSFIDIPDVYTKLVDGMNNYQTFEVNAGTVHLTRPKNLNGKQAAVLNAKGTLLFAKPAADLSDDQWRVLFNHLQVSN